MLLRGESGIGKSRMASALRERIQDDSRRTMVFQCSPFFVNSAFYPIRSSFERALRLGQDLDADARLDKLEAVVIDRLGLAKDDMRLIAALLSIPYQERYGSILVSPKLAKEETMRVLIDFTRAHARTAPTLMLFEDAHWADPTSLDLLGRFIEVLSGIPALMVITARPEFNSPLAAHPAVTVMNLAKFTPVQSESLVANVVGGKALPPGLAAQIVARTDGVPLYVEELTKTILESGDLIVEGDHYSYAGSSASVTIPETLRDSLMARLDRVAVSKEIAQVGSVIGREFSYELSAGLELMSEDALGKGLQHLTASGLATCQGEIPNSVYTFSHALVQDAAYDSLLKSRRKQLHGDIAHLLEERWPETRDTAPELLAYHYSSAEQYRVAAPLWLRAGEVAMQRFALPEAISHLRTGMAALAKLRPSKVRDRMEISLRTALGPALVAHRGWAHAEVSQILVPAWRLAHALKQSTAYLPILNALSLHYMTAGQLAESLRWAGRLSKIGAELGDDGLEIFGYRAASACHFWLGEFAKARRTGDQVHQTLRSGTALASGGADQHRPFHRRRHLSRPVALDDGISGSGAGGQPCHGGQHAPPRPSVRPRLRADAGRAIVQLSRRSRDAAALRRGSRTHRQGTRHRAARRNHGGDQPRRGMARCRTAGRGGAATRSGHRAFEPDRPPYLDLVSQGIAGRRAGAQRRPRARLEPDRRQRRADRGRRGALALCRDVAAERLDPGAARPSGRSRRDTAQGDRGGAQAVTPNHGSCAPRPRWRGCSPAAARTTEALALLGPVYDWFTEGHDTRDLKEAAQLLAEMQGSATQRTRGKKSKG